MRGTIEVHDEMDEMRAENEAMKVIPRVTLKEMLANPMLKIPLGISVMIMLCQQLSGINAVSFGKNITLIIQFKMKNNFTFGNF